MWCSFACLDKCCCLCCLCLYSIDFLMLFVPGVVASTAEQSSYTFTFFKKEYVIYHTWEDGYCLFCLLYFLKTTAIFVFTSDFQRSSWKPRNGSTLLVPQLYWKMTATDDDYSDAHTQSLASCSLSASHQIPAILASWIQRFVFLFNFPFPDNFWGEMCLFFISKLWWRPGGAEHVGLAGI